MIYVNKYWRKQKVQLIKLNKNFVWFDEFHSKLRIKINRIQFELVFIQEK